MNVRRPGVEAQPLLALPLAAGLRLRGQLDREWRQTQLYRWTLKGPPTMGLAVEPLDRRPVGGQTAHALLSGRMTLAGETLEIGPGGDPWDTASPSRAFAVELHRFAWLPDLLRGAEANEAERAAQEGLRLFLDWLSLFSSISPFAWGAETVERRLFNLACAAQ
jgi:uncharacterized heparinase superfamily protein